MAKGYRPVDRDQPFLFAPDMREWLPADHPVWLVIRAVDEHMDTSAFHARRKTGGAGTAGYDPDMLVTVLVWAYAHKVTSSREIERLCGTDVAFRVICAGNRPDHVTFARFRGDFPEATGEFFAQVLVLCARLGMGKLGTVALDGMKIAGNASKAANRTEEGLARLARETVAAHAAADAAEDELFGEGRRGDEVPEEAWRPRSRDSRIAAAMASLKADREAAEAAEEARAQAYRARRAAGERAGCPPASAAVAEAQENLARVRAARAAELADLEERYAAGQPRRGRPAGVDDHCRVRQAQAKVEAAKARAAEAERKAAEREANRKGPGPVRNLTDPDSRLMPVRGGGFLQGYNTQNMTSEDGLIIATELTDDPVDFAWFEPMTSKAEQAAALIEANRPASPVQEPGPASPAPEPGPGGPVQEPGPASPVQEPGPASPAPEPGPGGPVQEPGPASPAPEPGPGGPVQEPGPASPVPEPGPASPAPEPGPGGPVQEPGPASPVPEPGPASPAPEPGPGGPAPEPGPGGQDGGIGLVLADAGYCSEGNLTSPGPDRLIATGKGRDLEKAARAPDSQSPGRGGPATQAMRERLKTPDGIAAYRQRGHIAETPHGHIKHNMGIRHLSVRGKPKASAEWEFICAVHNLFKALSTGHLTGDALAALPG
jgi:transposase